jgi:hypothetical protein
VRGPLSLYLARRSQEARMPQARCAVLGGIVTNHGNPRRVVSQSCEALDALAA